MDQCAAINRSGLVSWPVTSGVFPPLLSDKICLLDVFSTLDVKTSRYMDSRVLFTPSEYFIMQPCLSQNVRCDDLTKKYLDPADPFMGFIFSDWIAQRVMSAEKTAVLFK